MNPRPYRLKLESCLSDAEGGKPAVRADVKAWIGRLVDGGNKAVVAVTLTSLLKKAVCPGQDVRRHQAKMGGGYSGRTLDHQVTTPFLKDNGFPAMAESGWLTRSFEQDAEYTMDYPGAIRKGKKEFLSILDAVEEGGEDPTPMITCMLQKLVANRMHQDVQLAMPGNLTLANVVRILEEHFAADYSAKYGGSRLPALAIHAIYQQLVQEVKRYRGCRLKPLKPHTAADRRTRSLGDVEVVGRDGRVCEAVEVKHNLQITPRMVSDAFDKFKSKRGLERYYILSTSERYDEVEAVTREILKASRKHGCQIIANGVVESVKYYLRMLESVEGFVKNYVELLETDEAVVYEHREMWNRIIGRGA